MSWEAIKDALQAKLQTASSSSKVHDRWRFTLEPVASDDFQDKFVDSGIINTIIITQENFADGQVFEDNRILRRHAVLITVIRSFKDSESVESENDFNQTLQNIANAFTSGDRTLEDICLCYSLPNFSSIDIDKFGNRKMTCHVCKIKMDIDEVLET